MKIVLAPDSFKGSVTAARAAEIMAEAAREVFPGCEAVTAPVADGGEGTLDAILSAMGGKIVPENATGPDGSAISSAYGITDGGKTAVIEMARASGITLMRPLNPMRATSRGTGELIAKAVAAGAERFIVGIGGSATNDGGMGMLAALGAEFSDKYGARLTGCGADLAKVAYANLSALPKISMDIICDVTNPLLGESGATYVYGPQKGATDTAVRELEAGMENYARVMQACGCPDSDFPGAGAAGGVGYALAGVLGGKIRRGIDAVLDITGFDSRTEGADLVLTGEGRLDAQSVLYGKVPAGVAMRCEKRGIPVIALVGALGAGADEYLKIGNTSMSAISDGPMTLESAMARAEILLESAARRTLLCVKIGMSIK